MSGIWQHLSRRGRLPLIATFTVLMAMVVVAPGVSARAAVKQFKASVLPPATALGQTPGTWTEMIQNCGSASTAPCTASSTIGLGTIQITVPTEFRPITTVTASSPSGQATRNWTVSYDSGAGTINGFANQGTDKLQPGESILFTFGATPSTCAGTKTFTTVAWGSTPTPGSDPFTLPPADSQPAITISGCGVTNGGTVTGPNGQTETVGGGFTGHVIVSFGGNLDCSGDPNFGSQWSLYHLPSQVTITPLAADYGPPPGGAPKLDTSKFPAVSGVDSSWYLICYSVPHDANHPNPFVTKGNGTATDVGGNWVGILPSCLESSSPPCVSEQFKGLPTSTEDHDMIVITTKSPPDDPAKH